MNDIHNASSKFHAILFADDTNLTSTLCSFDVNIDNNCNSLQLSTNYYSYKLYIVCIRYYKSLIYIDYIDMMAALR